MPKTCSFCLCNDHYLRNQTTVNCPKLLDTQCNRCYKFGHTTNFCKENPENPENPANPENPENPQNPMFGPMFFTFCRSV